MTVAPMQGVRVLDHGHVWAGPLLASMFADLGAEVIKIRGRVQQSGIAMTGQRTIGAPPGSADPMQYHSFDRGKRNISLDLRAGEGKQLYKQLVAVSDVIIENFSARVMPSLGLGYDVLAEVNPRIIMVSLSPTGATPGPWQDLMTYGPTLAALYGIKSVLGYQDDPQPREDPADLDPTAAAHAFVAVAAALEYRERSGRGQYIDIAQGEAGMQRIAEPFMDYFMNGRVAGPQGNRYGGVAPHGVYRAAGEDRWISIVARDDDEWRAILDVAASDAPSLAKPHFATLQGRLKMEDELDGAIEEWTQQHEAMALTHRLQAAGVPAFPYMGPQDVVADANWNALRRAHVRLGSAVGIAIDQLYETFPWKLTATPGIVQGPVPQPGEANDYVFGELLGLGPEDLSDLVQRNVL